jgi:hypothetical protein
MLSSFDHDTQQRPNVLVLRGACWRSLNIERPVGRVVSHLTFADLGHLVAGLLVGAKGLI